MMAHKRGITAALFLPVDVDPSPPAESPTEWLRRDDGQGIERNPRNA